jgi:DNA repair exonuclease SbcCD ATPase subunit
MAIIFENIRWKNFISTGNTFTEVDLSVNGTTLFIGENGAGKSTILDAMTFGMFGKAFRNINKPQLINSINKKDCLVEIEFRIESSKYKIIRGIKPNIFEVYCDGLLINQNADSRDYQTTFEKQVLKMNYKSFCQIFGLGSASYFPFMQLPALQRREIIEDLLNLQIFSVMNEILKKKIKENITETNDNNREKIVIEQKLELVKDHLRELQNKNEQFIKERREKIVLLQDNKYDKKVSLKILEKNIETTETTIDDYVSVVNKIDTIKIIMTKLNIKKEKQTDESNFFCDNEQCPSCNQIIDDTHRSNIIIKNREETITIDSALEKLQTKLDISKKRLYEIETIRKNITSMRSSIMLLESEIKNITHQILGIESEIRISSVNSDNNNTTKVIDLELELMNNIKEQNELFKAKQINSASSILLKDGGIKTDIINRYVPIINKLINKYMSTFDLFCDFQFDEQFNETIKSRNRDNFSYNSFSEGEKQRIDLSILFTWREIAKMRYSIDTNLLIMDEIFDSSLNSDGAECLMRILIELKSSMHIIIISHREGMEDKFDKVIKFKKSNNFSLMVD